MNIGFKVAEWQNKPFKEFTNEELLEYWYKLRLTCKTGEIDTSDYGRKGLSGELYVENLQQEIIDRMK
ncbi:MAG: hypothetical protein ACOCZ5_03525 [bacterium]